MTTAASTRLYHIMVDDIHKHKEQISLLFVTPLKSSPARVQMPNPHLMPFSGVLIPPLHPLCSTIRKQYHVSS